MFEKFIFDLQAFSAETYNPNPQVTSQNEPGKDMSATWKTFYNKALLENARPELIYEQFAKKTPIKGGKAEWRRANTFPPAIEPLEEGKIPDGSDFGMTKIEVTVTQHGDYTTISDRLQAEGYDPIIMEATEEMGSAMANTKNLITRNVLVAGNSVLRAGNKATRAELTGDDKITPALLNKAATWLKKNRAPKINGYYVCVLHPSVAEDLRESQEWIEAHKHADVAPIFSGEIGTLHGFRFVEDPDAKVWTEGADGAAVYGALCFGKDAFGTVTPEGEDTEVIVKDKSQIGGPIEQYSTVGYKFCHGTKILYEERMLRLETGSSYSATDLAN